MAHFFKYAIAKLHANPIRDERLNLGLLVFVGDELRVHSARNLEKIRAISASLDRTVIEQAFSNLTMLDSNFVSEGLTRAEERVDALTQVSPFKFSGLGQFSANDAAAYESAVNTLLNRLVEPEPTPRKYPSQKKTKLLTSIKSILRSEKILAKKGEGLESHRIVQNQELADGLNADLLLKNGAMHVMQTVDASHTDRSRSAIQEIGVSALVFEQARMQFGTSNTRPRLIYAANSQLEKSLDPALKTASHQGAELINWESHEQRIRFIVDMGSLAEPSTGQTAANFGPISGTPWG